MNDGTWADVASRLARTHGRRRVEVIASTARISGAVDLGSFTRLSDFVMALPGSLRLEDAVVLNRRGMPTTDREQEMRLRPEQLVIIGETGQELLLRTAPSAEAYVDKVRQQATLLTGDHIVHGSISLYPGATPSAYLESPDPPFIPVENASVRWLADRRLRRTFAFALVNRRHILGAATDDQRMAPEVSRTRAAGWG